MSRTASLTLTGLAVALVVAGVWYVAETQPHRDGSMSARTVPEPTEPRVAKQHEKSDARSEQVPTSTVGDYLADYWGAKWSVKKVKYSHLNLSDDLASIDLEPWEDVEERAHAQALAIWERGKKNLAKTYLLKLEDDPEPFKKTMGLPESLDLQAELPSLEAALADVDYELNLLLDQYITEVTRAIGQLRERGVERSPLLDLPQREPAHVVNSIFVEEGGWHVAYRISKEEFPLLAEIDASRKSLALERLHRMKEWAADLRK